MTHYSTGIMHLPVPDDTDPMALLPQTIRDMADALDLFMGALKPITAVYRSSDQSIPATTETAISWTNEDTDTLAAYPGTGTDITIPTGMVGLYAISARAHWNAGGLAASRQLFIRVNGTKIAANSIPAGTGSLASNESTAVIWPLADGDVVTAAAWHNDSGAGAVGIGGIGTGLLIARL